ncbi:hypothetical protein RDWZM_008263 [Blomia tropicalis]|uniref:AB hydrolase-1 domain-containing protein n=1 Tax=Blomia tropicalis TaxID=40697 RepID=A0A9Q0RL90_BLOTA|nr:hypothetical protein RDWZM_008263 [Blomia tropicalis]
MREYLRNIFRWRPTSTDDLDQAEQRILDHVKTPFKTFYVDIGQGWNLDHVKIWTLQMDASEPVNEPPLVLVHGFASGIALWSLNFDELSQNGKRSIYAFDGLGFGKSSRPKFTFPRLCNLSAKERALKHAEEMESQLVDCMEKWRSQMGGKLNGRFVLLGHSFGGYLAAAYALKYPEHISRLILADPFGFQGDSQQEVSENGRITSAKQYPMAIKMGTKLFLDILTPLSILRASGPWGPKLISNVRADIEAKFSELSLNETTQTDETINQNDPKTRQIGMIMNYLYHCNVQCPPSGEIAFKKLIHYTAWPRMPMLERISSIAKQIPIDFIYGSQSWIDYETGYKAQSMMPNHKVDVHLIKGAGHHVYADQAYEFNQLVSKICSNAVGDKSYNRERNANDEKSRAPEARDSKLKERKPFKIETSATRVEVN